MSAPDIPSPRLPAADTQAKRRGLGADLRVLLHLLRGQPKDGDQRARLEAFYGPQAGDYDAFRDRLLHGREALIGEIQAALGNALPGAHLIELGGGTGRNLEFFGPRIDDFGQVTLVDLCPALLEQARRKFAEREHVHIIEADATSWQPEQPADAIYCAYSLTMIPDWRAALANAIAMLKPGGIFGVVDFYVSAAHPPADQIRHNALARAFWPRWFAHDGVHLNPVQLAALREHFPEHQLTEARAPVPYLPGLAVPYYRFVGRKL
ncbi:class I SAM-dependent methyltransferase [Thiorhodovibrio frisius]|uniref:Methylase involved in ubiquinone/menaquinone biosynthesis n=1 Tax=Thiorhodovibrio frisius TaxID=631362 RepID=H8Z4G0_9GAMM|nr:class I SAM-dependent methyltransferase [Thiorhodovibrio frisius]EIC20217.1 methylase involved in ubiquinone/menaquinone biosynthesis [Thiorhodovibrio frisius]WPL20955.1 Ubiquinone/menaquinone biosynthesis methyltransferase ubiE [Thiorhodovibrio frisius]